MNIRNLREVFSKHIFFIKCRRQHFKAIRWSMYTKFTFTENTGRDFLIVESANFLGNDRLLFFISIKTLQEPFCSNCYILLVKKRTAVAAAQEAENHEDE